MRLLSRSIFTQLINRDSTQICVPYVLWFHPAGRCRLTGILAFGGVLVLYACRAASTLENGCKREVLSSEDPYGSSIAVTVRSLDPSLFTRLILLDLLIQSLDRYPLA